MECRFCYKEFTPSDPRRRYCSDECYKGAKKEQNKKYHSSKTKMLTSKCILCGKEFTTPYPHKKYCSKECQRAAVNSNRIYAKTCAKCGNEYQTRNRASRYCSDNCKSLAIKEKSHWRELTKDTPYLICLYTFRDHNSPELIADLLNRDVEQVKQIIADCRADGRLEKYQSFYNAYINSQQNYY